MPDTVLVIDDEPAMRLCLALLLERSGRTASLAATAEDGLACAAEGRFSAVILDLTHGEIDGFSVLTALRQAPATREAAIVVATACNADATRAKAAALGASACLVKPYRHDELVAALGRTAGHG